MRTHSYQSNHRIGFMRQVENDHVDQTIGKMKIDVTVVVAARVGELVGTVLCRKRTMRRKLGDSCLKLGF